MKGVKRVPGLGADGVGSGAGGGNIITVHAVTVCQRGTGMNWTKAGNVYIFI